GGQGNHKNITALRTSIFSIKPDVVINQMPYEKKLVQALYQLKLEINFVLLGCLRNSLFNFKSNVRDRMSQLLPPMAFKLLDNRLGIYFIQKRHWLSHRKDLKEILDKHDKFILLAPPNRKELEHFV